MIKKIVIVLSFFFLNNVAIADQKVHNWVFVGKNLSESSIYIDINNITTKSKNIKQYWTKLNSTKPYQLNGKDYSSLRAFMEVKCDENMVSTNYLKFYQNHDNRGETTADFGKLNVWDMIIPGSIESIMVFKYVCK
jgi:hypothetical protein